MSCYSVVMYFVYVIQSELNKKLYVGFSQNPKQRLETHNSGGNVSTKSARPWILIYIEGYRDKTDAMDREKFLKTGSGKLFIKKQLKHFFL
ncbi:MAG: GIY-YIG nuclease family protein [Candidatus Saccharibacteria bacterium]